MSTVGPQLPSASSEKRKRNIDDDSTSDSDSQLGPMPLLDDESSAKRPRTIGPSLPPASNLHENKSETEQIGVQNEKDSTSSEDDDDDFGPSLPAAGQSAASTQSVTAQDDAARPANASVPPSQRDAWMMVPPTGGDWSARVDPTKLKSRKFNTGKGAKSSPGAGNAASTWHETPAEKQVRLQREMMGIKDSSITSKPTQTSQTEPIDSETARRLAEYNKSRGPTLYATHQQTKTEEDDDPSARAFDREKDIGGGLQINSTKRKEMLKNASNLGSRFGSAKYL